MQVTIIEDDAMVSDVLKIALEGKGFDVTVYPEQVVADVCSSHPDILVVDMGYPYERGVRFCQDISRQLPECRLLPMTGGLEHPDEIAFIDGSSAPVFQKPFSLHKLLGEIESQAVHCRQHNMVSMRETDDAFKKSRHEMRNVAMVVYGSATLLHDTAEEDVAMKQIADKIVKLCQRGLDEASLPLLQQYCYTAIEKSGDNLYFRKNADRILRACTRGIALLSKATPLFHGTNDVARPAMERECVPSTV